jgi:hypothetical protein
MSSTQRQARIAGFWYFLLAVTAPLGLVYVPGQLIVPGNAAATADHLRAMPGLARAGIASELVHQIVCIFLVLALYRLFRAVDEGLARQMVILGALVSVPIVFVNVLNQIAALWLASGADVVATVEKPTRDALAAFFLRLHADGIQVTAIFWGLWLFPFGLLVIRSRFLPRVLGILLMLAGVAYLASSFAALIVPQWEPMVSRVTLPMKLGELPITLWLLIRGARPATVSTA